MSNHLLTENLEIFGWICGAFFFSNLFPFIGLMCKFQALLEVLEFFSHDLLERKSKISPEFIFVTLWQQLKNFLDWQFSPKEIFFQNKMALCETNTLFQLRKREIILASWTWLSLSSTPLQNLTPFSLSIIAAFFKDLLKKIHL